MYRVLFGIGNQKLIGLNDGGRAAVRPVTTAIIPMLAKQYDDAVRLLVV